MSNFLNMGGYGAFIWPAYAASAVGLGIATIWTVAAWRRAKARLKELEKTALEKKS